jgi:hypothetical protein
VEDLPLRLRCIWSSGVTDAILRSNGILDFRLPLTLNHVNDVKSSNIMVDPKHNLWFHRFTPTSNTTFFWLLIFFQSGSVTLLSPSFIGFGGPDILAWKRVLVEWANRDHKAANVGSPNAIDLSGLEYLAIAKIERERRKITKNN